MSAYKKLTSLFSKQSHLDHLQAIAGWDEAVMMPAGGGNARAKALATLSVIQHDMLTQPHLLELIKAAKQQSIQSEWEQRNLQLIEKKITTANCLPPSLVEKITHSSLTCEQAWRTLRANNNWKEFKPLLETVVTLVKESAEIRSQAFNMSRYDVLIDSFSPDINQEIIDPIFSRLKKSLPNLIKTITSKQQSRQLIQPQGPFDIEQQKQLGLALMQAIGFDFNHGRLDVSHHPFCGGVAADVRITTRYNTTEFISAIMGICHETGHACYEQGLPTQWSEQPVGLALGMSVHESQSLLIEMQACRSDAFITFLTPLIEKHFGHQDAFTAENLLQSYTAVTPSLIRVDADEVTYPLHVILRYELEKDLIEGDLTVAELPEAWNSKMQQYLGLTTHGNDRDGVMQDVHWPSGAFGYFPAYTLGSLIAAQLFNHACKQHPEIPSQLSNGRFQSLMSWLRQHVHQYGSLLTTTQLLKQATNETLNPDYFLQHIQKRYLT